MNQITIIFESWESNLKNVNPIPHDPEIIQALYFCLPPTVKPIMPLVVLPHTATLIGITQKVQCWKAQSWHIPKDQCNLHLQVQYQPKRKSTSHFGCSIACKPNIHLIPKIKLCNTYTPWVITTHIHRHIIQSNQR